MTMSSTTTPAGTGPTDSSSTSGRRRGAAYGLSWAKRAEFPSLSRTFCAKRAEPRSRAGGEGEIRTLDGPVTHNGFRDRRLQPLGHLSETVCNGGPDRIRTGVLGLDRAACLARLHHGTDGG